MCAPSWALYLGPSEERDRFRRAGAHSARESALTSAGFVKSGVTGQWLEGTLDDEEYTSPPLVGTSMQASLNCPRTC